MNDLVHDRYGQIPDDYAASDYAAIFMSTLPFVLRTARFSQPMPGLERLARFPSDRQSVRVRIQRSDGHRRGTKLLASSGSVSIAINS